MTEASLALEKDRPLGTGLVRHEIIFRLCPISFCYSKILFVLEVIGIRGKDTFVLVNESAEWLSLP